MARSFLTFWKELSRGRIEALTADEETLHVPPATFRELLRVAYNRGAIDVLLDQREAELKILEQLQLETDVDRAHAEFRNSVPKMHFETDHAKPVALGKDA